MPKPILLRLLIRTLQAKGFMFISQKGSHAKFVRGRLMTIVPILGKEIPYGTFRSILRQTKLSKEDFEK